MTERDIDGLHLRVSRNPSLNDGYFNAAAMNFTEQLGPTSKRIFVDKTTHRICYENESESQVTIVIEPKEAE